MKKIGYISLVGLCLMVACKSKTSEQNETTVSPVEQVKKVDVVIAKYENVANSQTYTGTIQAYQTNNITTIAGARIEKLNVEIGDYVKKGEQLLECSTLNYDQALLKTKNAKAELDRMEALYQKGGVSKSDLEALQLSYSINVKNVEELKRNTFVKSPINGVVVAKNFEVGDTYPGGQPVLVIQEIKPVKILIGISESDYSLVSLKSKVVVSVDALGKEFEGKINKIYPTIDPVTHTVTVEVILPNTDLSLRPGMFASVKVIFGTQKSIVVPDQAVVRQMGSSQRVVYIVTSDNKVKMSVVNIGKQLGRNIEILDGVKDGELVVYKGASSLKADQEVEPVIE